MILGFACMHVGNYGSWLGHSHYIDALTRIPTIVRLNN